MALNLIVLSALLVDCTFWLLKSEESKEARVKIHRCIKSTFANLDSNGIERDGKRYIRVTYHVHKG